MQLYMYTVFHVLDFTFLCILDLQVDYVLPIDINNGKDSSFFIKNPFFVKKKFLTGLSDIHD